MAIGQVVGDTIYQVGIVGCETELQSLVDLLCELPTKKVKLMMPRGDYGAFSKAKSLKSWLEEAYPRDLQAAFGNIFESMKLPFNKGNARLPALGVEEPSEYGVYSASLGLDNVVWDAALELGNTIIQDTNGAHTQSAAPAPTATANPTPVRTSRRLKARHQSSSAPLSPHQPPHQVSRPPPSRSPTMTPARRGLESISSAWATSPRGPMSLGRAENMGWVSGR